MPLENRAHIEAWGGSLLGELVARGKDGLSEEGKTYAGWAREDFAWFRRLEKFQPGLSSWNWDVVLAACLLWLDPGFHDEVTGFTIADWWADWLALQVGDPQLDPSRFADLALCRCFDGSETLSSVYGSARYGAVFAVRLLALRFPKHPAAPELIRLTGRYMEVLATLLSLSSAPWTDPGYKAANGRLWYIGPTWAPVGERSEAAGLQCGQGAILGHLRGNPVLNLRSDRFEYACIPWLETLGREFPAENRFASSAPESESNELAAISVADLEGVRLWSETHWLRWPEGLLVYSPKRLNSNTPKIFWAWLDDSEKRMTIGYPFPSGRHRGKEASGAPGSCVLAKGARGQWFVSADGIDGGPLTSMDLPVSSEPLWHIVGDREGFRMLEGG